VPIYALKLNASPSDWRLFMMRKADPAFLAFSQKIFERDKYTCQFCGFQAKVHQEIINLDFNYRNNAPDNLVTACCFCTQCFFLESVGKQEYGGGTMIYLPTITQNDLNGLCHVLFYAMANATEYQNEAQNIYRTLTLRSKIVEKILGEGMMDPALLGKMLIDAYIENRGDVSETIAKSLRLLPSRDRFAAQIADWTGSAFKEMLGSKKG
jgi:intracellular multiplication protein IcmJ